MGTGDLWALAPQGWAAMGHSCNAEATHLLHLVDRNEPGAESLEGKSQDKPGATTPTSPERSRGMARAGNVCGGGAVPKADRLSKQGSTRSRVPRMPSPVACLQRWPKAAATGEAGNTERFYNTGSHLPAASSSAPSLTVPNMQCAFLTTKER